MRFRQFRIGASILTVGGLLVAALIAALIHTRPGSLPGSEVEASVLPFAQEEAMENAHNAPRKLVKKSTFAALNFPDIDEHHRQLAEKTLRSFPAGCRWALKNFYVKSDGSVKRAYGGKSSIYINGDVNDEEFVALLTHEYGHITDLGCLRGNFRSGKSNFADGPEPVWNDDPSIEFYRISWESEDVQRAGTTPEDFISGYAAWNVYEDFGEMFAAEVLQPEYVKARAKTNAAIAAKHAFMRAYVFRDFNPPAKGLAEWTGSVPWDVTLLPYEWGA